MTIAQAESGRPISSLAEIRPWPWTIDADGTACSSTASQPRSPGCENRRLATASSMSAACRSICITMPAEPVHLSYLLRQNGAAWQIINVYLNGTISELATPRSESGSILRGQGIDGLIVTLNAEADTLAAHPS